MTAGLMLAAAVLLYPDASRSRAGVASPAGTGRASTRATAWAAAAAAVGVAAILPLCTVLALALIVGTAVVRHRRRAVRVRAQREGRSLGAALELLTAELKAGAHPVQAFEAAATETSDPVGSRLRTVAARARLGADVAAGLSEAAGTSRLPQYWERLAVCWRLAADHGLPIGVLMQAAQHDVAERHRYGAQVDAGMAGARATAAILAALPLLGVVFGEMLGAAPVAFLSRGAGGWVLVVGVGLLCAGVLWSGRITDRLPV